MNKRIPLVAVIASALPIIPAHAMDSSGGLRISVTVPESCHLDAGEVQFSADGGQLVTTVTEICNSGRAFQVTASHRQLASAEKVSVFYAGNAVSLSDSGLSEIALRRGPTFERVPVAIDASNLETGIAISFGMTAI